MEQLHAHAKQRYTEKGLDERILSTFFHEMKEFPPVCAVMGGLVGNELVKIVSLKGDPIQNILLYDMFDGKGLLHLIG